MTYNLYILLPLSGRGTQINVVELTEYNQTRYLFKWGSRYFQITEQAIGQMIIHFFTPGLALQLGAMMDNPPVEGFGYYLRENHEGLLPRDASAIAPLLVALGKLTFSTKGNSIWLTRAVQG